MAINWPIPSKIGEIHDDANGTKWRWNGKAWVSLGASFEFGNTDAISEVWVTNKIYWIFLF
jgi:hypothetical protein